VEDPPLPPYDTSNGEYRLHLATNADRKATVTGTPAVSIDHLADVAPEHVEPPVAMEGDSYSRNVSVVADHQTSRRR
jgi:hypothetical protein